MERFIIQVWLWIKIRLLHFVDNWIGFWLGGIRNQIYYDCENWVSIQGVKVNITSDSDYRNS